MKKEVSCDRNIELVIPQAMKLFLYLMTYWHIFEYEGNNICSYIIDKLCFGWLLAIFCILTQSVT